MYQYEPLPSTQHIRLVEVKRSDSFPIECSLKTVDLESNPTYRCLSYTWGAPRYSDNEEEWSSDNNIIFLDGAEFRLRCNIHDALIQFRALYFFEPIWIDAICIAQYDVLERNAQVANMANIYAGAEKVLVWLGYGDIHTETAIRCMERMHVDLQPLAEEKVKNRVKRLEASFHGVVYSDNELEDMLRFFRDYRWFARLWTLQEVVLAKEIVFVCGSVLASPETMIKGSAILYDVDELLQRRFPERRQGFHSRDCSIGYRFAINMLFEMRRRRERWSFPTIAQQAHFCRGMSVSDPKDNIYGLLGISSLGVSAASFRAKSDVENPRGDDPILEVDYAKNVEEIYTDAFRYSLYSSQDLRLLSLTEPSWRKNLDKLPSWIPDYSQPRAINVVVVPDNAEFETCTVLGVTIRFVAEEPRILFVEAAPFDRIVQTCRAYWVTEDDLVGVRGLLDLLFLEPQVLQLYGSVLTTTLADLLTMECAQTTDGEEQRKASGIEISLFRRVLWATYSCNLELANSFFDSTEGQLADVLRLLGCPAAAAKALKDAVVKGRHSFDSIETALWSPRSGQENEFDNKWYLGTKCRCLFRTERGYLGSALEGVRKADEVYIFRGAKVPHVLRPMAGDAINAFTFLGEAYVNGIMWGEAVDEIRDHFREIAIH